MVSSVQSKYSKYKLKYLQLSQNISQSGGTLGSAFSLGCYEFCYNNRTNSDIRILFKNYLMSTYLKGEYTVASRVKEIMNFHSDKKESIHQLLVDKSNLKQYLTDETLDMMSIVFTEFNKEISLLPARPPSASSSPARPPSTSSSPARPPSASSSPTRLLPARPPSAPPLILNLRTSKYYYYSLESHTELVITSPVIKQRFESVFYNEFKYIPFDENTDKKPYFYERGELKYYIVPLFIDTDTNTGEYIEMYLRLKFDEFDKTVAFLQKKQHLNKNKESIVEYSFSNYIKINENNQPELINPLYNVRNLQTACDDASTYYLHSRLNKIHNHLINFKNLLNDAPVMYVPHSTNKVYVVECLGGVCSYTYITKIS